MVGDAGGAVGARRFQRHVAQEVGDVADAPADARGALVGEHEAVVAHRRAAARGRGDDGVERLIGFAPGDVADEGAGVAARLRALAEMVIERTAAAGAFDGRDFETVAHEDADCGAGDAGSDDFLHAAEMECHAHHGFARWARDAGDRRAALGAWQAGGDARGRA